MNQKKKICIGIIIVLTLVIIISFTFIFIKSKNKQLANIDSSNITTEEKQEQIEKLLEADNNITTENISDANVIEENSATTENNTSKSEIKLANAEETEKVITQVQASSSTNEKSITEPKTVETVQNSNEEIRVVQTQTQVTTQLPIQISEKAEENTQPVIKQDEPTKEEIKLETKDEELYVRNDTMINQIRQVIESNASENMMTYGYEIVVDSSIKELTNQFTFTENRVKSAITNKFGTIRIYAEDYYKNGQLIMTECYII